MNDITQKKNTYISDEKKLKVRTDLRAGAVLDECRITSEGLCSTICCPSEDGERCATVCPVLTSGY